MEFSPMSNNIAPMMNMPMTNVAPMENAVMPAQMGPMENIASAYVQPPVYVHHAHCCVPKVPVISPAGTILVLFILLVIISRAHKY